MRATKAVRALVDGARTFDSVVGRRTDAWDLPHRPVCPNTKARAKVALVLMDARASGKARDHRARVRLL